MSQRPLAVLAFLAVTFGASGAHAGPWAPEPGHGYVKLWLKYLYGFSFNDGEMRSFDYGGYHEVFLSAYAELGVADDVGLVLHAPLVQTFHLEDPRDGSYRSHVGPGDPTLSLRWQFLTLGRFVAGAEAGVRAPFARAGPVQDFYGVDEGNPRLGALQIGTGVWDFPVSLGAGYGWDGFYLAGSVGYIVRTDGFAHVLTWTAEGGATVSAEVGVRARVTGHHALGVYFDEGAPGHLSPSGIGNGTNYIGFAVEVDYQIEESYWLGLSVEGGIPGTLARQTGGPVVNLYFANRF